MRTHVKTPEKKQEYSSLNKERKEGETPHLTKKLHLEKKKVNRRLKLL